MSLLSSFRVKRALFILCTMLPVLLYAEYTGHTSLTLTCLAAGVCSGVSVVLFPDPAFLEKRAKEKAKEGEQQTKKPNDSSKN